MRTRPRCAYCNKPAPKLTTTVWAHLAADTNTSRQADGTWYRHLYLEAPLRSIADCRRHSNQHVVSVTYWSDDTVTRFAEWDGETYWLKYGGLFCSTPCAVKFARAAHQAGYRIKETTQ